MDQAIFDELKQSLASRGPAETIEHLCRTLRENKDYSGLFYALLMKKRHELGVSPLPTGPSSDLPERVHEPYEEGIRSACREVGRLFLDQGDIVQATPYWRMIGELDTVRTALDKYEPFEGEDIQPLIELAFHNGVHPRRGFAWLLQRHGICSAITVLSSALQGQQGAAQDTAAREWCIQSLIRALHEQLIDRLRNEIVQREGSVDNSLTVTQLLAGRDWLFAEDNYHIDTSHLSAVVQMSIQLPSGPELKLARDLAAYEAQLSPRFSYQGEPPFENQYRDYGVYLAILDGDQVAEGLAHFRAKVEEAAADPDGINPIPAEVLINLLLRLERPAEALEVARKYLAGVDERQVNCPGVAELCRRVNDYRALAEVSRDRGDAVNFLAGLILANGK